MDVQFQALPAWRYSWLFSIMQDRADPAVRESGGGVRIRVDVDVLVRVRRREIRLVVDVAGGVLRPVPW
jgi:hypothetical protein